MSAWIEINLDNLSNNIMAIRRKVGPDIKIMAVVKADGYGHGAAKIAEACIAQGIDRLAVALVQEGIELRQAGIKVPILIMGAILPEQVQLVSSYSLTPTVFNMSLANLLAETGRKNKETIKCHVRIDVGSASLGVTPGESVSLVEKITDMEWLEVEGIFTHLPSVYGNDKKLIDRDVASFDQLLKRLREKGISIPIVHAASSPGIMRIPKAYYNLVRPGTSLYGLPSFKGQEDWGLKPVMQLKAKIVDIKKLDNGQQYGYGNKHQSVGSARLAIVSLGYADGLFMFFLKKGQVLIGDKIAPIMGRSYMSHFLVDVTHIPEAKSGDEVIILGKSGEQVISAEEIANQAEIGTTNCEIVCLLSKSITRIYKEAGVEVESSKPPMDLLLPEVN